MSAFMRSAVSCVTTRSAMAPASCWLTADTLPADLARHAGPGTARLRWASGPRPARAMRRTTTAMSMRPSTCNGWPLAPSRRDGRYPRRARRLFRARCIRSGSPPTLQFLSSTLSSSTSRPTFIKHAVTRDSSITTATCLRTLAWPLAKNHVLTYDSC